LPTSGEIEKNSFGFLQRVLFGLPTKGTSDDFMAMDYRSVGVELSDIAKKGDVILVAGKGHEDYQDVKGVKHHFDDREIIRNIFNLQKS